MKVNVAGAGTVKGFQFGPTGTVDINKSSEVADLPVTIEDCAGMENLSARSVSVGGAPRSSKSLAFKNGVLTVISKGISVSFK